jgi:hypothetical protein
VVDVEAAVHLVDEQRVVAVQVEFERKMFETREIT